MKQYFFFIPFLGKVLSMGVGEFLKMSRSMRFPTMWYVRQAKPQISLQVIWIFYDCWATDWTPSGVSKLKRRHNRLVWVYTRQNATLLEITCRGSNYVCDLSPGQWSCQWVGCSWKIAVADLSCRQLSVGELSYPQCVLIFILLTWKTILGWKKSLSNAEARGPLNKIKCRQALFIYCPQIPRRIKAKCSSNSLLFFQYWFWS